MRPDMQSGFYSECRECFFVYRELDRWKPSTVFCASDVVWNLLGSTTSGNTTEREKSREYELQGFILNLTTSSPKGFTITRLILPT